LLIIEARSQEDDMTSAGVWIYFIDRAYAQSNTGDPEDSDNLPEIS